MITAFAGKETALAADAAAVAAGFALVVVAGYAPCGTEGDLGADAAAALFALLFDSVLRAFDIKGAADIGINASGMGLGTVQHGIALAALLALAVVLVLLFAGGFKAETGFDGQEDGALLSVVAFKGVGYFADGIGQLVGLGAGGQGLHRKKIQGSKPPTLTRYSAREKISYPTAYRFLQRYFQDDR